MNPLLFHFPRRLQSKRDVKSTIVQLHHQHVLRRSKEWNDEENIIIIIVPNPVYVSSRFVSFLCVHPQLYATQYTQPLSTNHDWPSNRCHRKKSINSSVGGGSSPKEFTKLFYDHCCVLPNHIPCLSVLVHVTLCGQLD